MIDTTEFYSLTQVCDLDHESRWKGCKKRYIFCAYDLTKFQMDFAEIGYAVDTCWSDEPPTPFISSSQYSKEITQLIGFHVRKKNKLGLHLDIYKPISIKLALMIETF